MALFKDVAPSKPFKVKAGQLVPFWAKVTRTSDEALVADTGGVNPQAGALKKAPPLSAPHFITRLKERAFAIDKDRELCVRLYRAAVEDGFNSLGRLCFSRLDWTDDDVAELASALEEVRHVAFPPPRATSPSHHPVPRGRAPPSTLPRAHATLARPALSTAP